MAEVGELTWVAEIQGLANAKRDAESMSDGVGELADDARAADDAVGSFGGTASSTQGEMRSMGSASGLLGGAIALLNGNVVQLILSMTGLAGTVASVKAAFSTLAGLPILAWLSTLAGWITTAGSAIGTYLLAGLGKLVAIGGTLVAWGKAFVGWLAAGSAGALAFAAAIGAVIGLIGVWILKITGVLDWIGQLGTALGKSLPGWARDAILAVTSIFAGGLAVLGGLILGFMEGGLSGAIERGKEVLMIFVDAWSRLFDGVRDAWGDFKSWLTDSAAELGQSLTDFITDGVRGVWNTVIPETVGFPEVTLPTVQVDAGPLGSATVGGQTVFRGFSFDLPQLQTGGFVESGGAVEVHDDEMVLPADVSRDVIDALRGGGGGEGAGSGEQVTVRIDQLAIDIGDQTLDLRELGRFELEQLAELIGEQMGDELKRLV